MSKIDVSFEVTICALLVGAVPGVGGCERQIGPGVTGLYSLRVTMRDPAPDPVSGEIGSPREPAHHPSVTFDIEAIGADGRRVAEDFDADVFINFGGGKVGQFSLCGTDDPTPLATAHLRAGVAMDQRADLRRAWGEATVWIEVPSTGVFGGSPRIHLPPPLIPTLLRPPGLECAVAQTRCDADADCCTGAVCDSAATGTCQLAETFTYCSPFNERFAVITGATGDGRLVVTRVFHNGYVVADTGAPFDPGDRTAMSGFNHLFVFTFSRPEPAIRPGLLLAKLSGILRKFSGFNQLNTPGQEWMVDDSDRRQPVYDVTRIPAAVRLQDADRSDDVKLTRLSAATVTLTGTVCRLDDRWTRYREFILSAGKGGCDAFRSFQVELPSARLGALDPEALADTPTRVTITGALRNVSGQKPGRSTYDFWTIFPGTPDDVGVEAD